MFWTIVGALIFVFYILPIIFALIAPLLGVTLLGLEDLLKNSGCKYLIFASLIFLCLFLVISESYFLAVFIGILAIVVGLSAEKDDKKNEPNHVDTSPSLGNSDERSVLLLAPDEPKFSNIAKSLRKNNIETSIYYDGKTALEKLRAERIYLILVSPRIDKNGMDAGEFINEIVKNPQLFNDPKIIFLTELPITEDWPRIKPILHNNFTTTFFNGKPTTEEIVETIKGFL